jgi:hypothetical protein
MTDKNDETTADTAPAKPPFKSPWLYFIVVPIAAISTASLAIIITALEGLKGHSLGPELFAKTAIAGLALIASIAAGYLLAAFVIAVLRLIPPHDWTKSFIRRYRRIRKFQRKLQRKLERTESSDLHWLTNRRLRLVEVYLRFFLFSTNPSTQAALVIFYGGAIVLMIIVFGATHIADAIEVLNRIANGRTLE